MFIKTNKKSCAYVDIGPVQLAVHSRAAAALPAGEVVGRTILRDLDVTKTLVVLQDQIEGLTLGTPDVRTDELPLRLQCHTTDMPSQWSRLLSMIAQAVTSYHLHH